MLPSAPRSWSCWREVWGSSRFEQALRLRGQDMPLAFWSTPMSRRELLRQERSRHASSDFLRRSRLQSVEVCPTVADSTYSEVADVERCMKAAGATSALIVTSDFHTRRALSIFRKRLPQYEWSVAASSWPGNAAEQYWKHRWWAKSVLDEWEKYLWWQAVDRWRSDVVLRVKCAPRAATQTERPILRSGLGRTPILEISHPSCASADCDPHSSSEQADVIRTNRMSLTGLAAATTAHCLLIELHQRPPIRLRRMRRFRPCPRRAAQARAQIRIRQQLKDRLRHRLRIARLHHQPGHSIFKNFRNSTNPVGHNRQSRRHGFKYHIGGSLTVGWHGYNGG